MTGTVVFPIGYDWIAEQSDTECVVCLSEKERQALLSITDQIGFETRWYHEDESGLTDAEIEYIHDFVDQLTRKLVMANCGEPTQQEDISRLQLEINQNVLIANTLLGLYDGESLTSINSNAPEDFLTGDESDERVTALCIALQAYVVSVINDYQKRLFVGGLLSDVAAGLLALLGPLGAIAAIGVRITFGLAIEEIMEAITDEEAINTVVCCMKDVMFASPSTFAFFQSVDPTVDCEFTPGSSEAFIGNLINLSCQDKANFAVFGDALGKAYLYALEGVSDCVCVCQPLSYDFSVLSVVDPWIPATLTDAPAGGVFNGNSNQQGYDFVLASGAIASGGYNTNDRSVGGVLDIAETCLLVTVAVTFQSPGVGSAGFNVGAYYSGAWHFVGGFVSTPAGIPGGYHRFVANLDPQVADKVMIIVNAPFSVSVQKIELYFA